MILIMLVKKFSGSNVYIKAETAGMCAGKYGSCCSCFPLHLSNLFVHHCNVLIWYWPISVIVHPWQNGHCNLSRHQSVKRYPWLCPGLWSHLIAVVRDRWSLENVWLYDALNKRHHQNQRATYSRWKPKLQESYHWINNLTSNYWFPHLFKVIFPSTGNPFLQFYQLVLPLRFCLLVNPGLPKIAEPWVWTTTTSNCAV